MTPASIEPDAAPTRRAATPSRLERIAVKSGLSLGLMGEADRAATLAFAAIHFVPGSGYDEKGVNAVLRDWLAEVGPMLRSDHVEIRRWLVDAGWLERDGFGRRYALAASAPERAAALLGDRSAAGWTACLQRARAAERERREARRQHHAAPGPVAA